MKKVLLLLAAVILVAGCTGFGGVFQGSVVSTNEKTPDILIVPEDSKKVPNVLALDEDFSVRFNIKNQGTDVRKEYAKDVSVSVHDTGLCKVGSGTSAVALASGQVIDGFSGKVSASPTKKSIAPGGEETAELNLRTPSAGTPFAGDTASCNVNFKVSYKFSSLTDATVGVISKKRIEQGVKSTTKYTENIGIGPIKINLGFGQQEFPVRAGSIIDMDLSVENKGEGEFDEVPTGKLVLLVPKDLTSAHPVSKDAPCDKFQKNSAKSTADTNAFANSEPIKLVGKKSNVLRCFFQTNANLQDEKTYFLTSSIEDYNYEIFGSVAANIKTK